VVVVSQAPRNAVDLSLYQGGAAALAEGAISGGDMTSVAALTKLMCVLGSTRGARAIQREMERSVAGGRWG
jgi:L-asparaginase